MQFTCKRIEKVLKFGVFIFPLHNCHCNFSSTVLEYTKLVILPYKAKAAAKYKPGWVSWNLCIIILALTVTFCSSQTSLIGLLLDCVLSASVLSLLGIAPFQSKGHWN